MKDEKTISLSHLSKLLFPQDDITKQNVIEYYQKIAPWLLPLIKDHFVVMNRFPDGVDQDGFYQKQISDYFPDWINRKKILLKKGSYQELLFLTTKDDLVYLANQNVVEFHSWLSLIDRPNYPDKMVFDLDPDKNNSVQDIYIVAYALKKLIESYQLTAFIMTTGSKGYHIVVPIFPEHVFEIVHNFAKKLGHIIEMKYPDICTVNGSKKARTGKIFIDYLRNSYGQTSIAPYSLRAKKGAPVATPIDWNELKKTSPEKYTIFNIFKRLARKNNPWKDFVKKRQKIIRI